ncbi:MAG TPA: hypothetical protein VL069_02170 [Opitutus sp.]|nr:hypothetical protein [Opitutus sp.]
MISLIVTASSFCRASLVVALSLWTFLFTVQTARADLIAVASRSFNGYTRTRLPDNSFKRETYAFANGGRWNAPVAGDSIDKLSFNEIARTIAVPLAERGYFPAPDPDNTDLLIFVFWGTTYGSRDQSGTRLIDDVTGSLNQIALSPNIERGADGIVSPETAVANAQRDELESSLIQLAIDERWKSKADAMNAGILGFQEDLKRAYTIDFTVAARDLFDELEANRYFVVMKAYDFRLAWKEKRAKILWETRFSIRQEGNDFGQQLAVMTRQASRYFGQHTRGLVRDVLPEVRIDIGEARVMEDAPER